MASCGSGNNYPEPIDNCDDCVQVVKTTKRVRVPCTRNTYKQYTVKVPRQVTENVARTVNYTDYENRSKTVPYQTTRMETRYRNDTQSYQVPVTRTVTKKVSVTRKVPKTIYVDVVTQECRPSQVTEMQTRTRQVRIPYQTAVNETKYRTVNEQVPVQRSKVVYDKVNKTVFDTQVRTRCEPEVKYVTKEVPVYNVIAKNPGGCAPCGDAGASSGAAMVDSGYGASGGAAVVDSGYGASSGGGYGGASSGYATGGYSGAATATTLPAPVSSGYGASGGYGGAATLPAPANDCGC